VKPALFHLAESEGKQLFRRKGGKGGSPELTSVKSDFPSMNKGKCANCTRRKFSKQKPAKSKYKIHGQTVFVAVPSRSKQRYQEAPWHKLKRNLIALVLEKDEFVMKSVRTPP
jgi:hypothetical protein